MFIFVGFDYDDATVLSECTIIGSYIIQTIINWPKHHPVDKTRHIIYWDAVLILLPAQIGGSNIGVILKKGLPATIFCIKARSRYKSPPYKGPGICVYPFM